MAKIMVRAMKDILYTSQVGLDRDGRCQTNMKLWKAGEEFEIEEKDFSDWNKVQNIKGIVFRGSMVKVGAEPLVVADVAPVSGSKEAI